MKVPGSYHGVTGTYRCTPDGTATTCSATVADIGFTLGAGVWLFDPGNNANARVTDAPDDAYASYGWWLRTAANGDLTASAFHDFKGSEATAVALPAAGTATYVGGAAGKYALRSSTGGTNDAGHFTARATLEAEFGAGTESTISGTIDNFMGADGQSRAWSVELMEQNIGATGTILGDDGTGTAKETKWTIGENAADAAGQWSGNLREMGDDGVPQVATGTFYSTYGTAGNMVGAFGANNQ